MLTKLDRRNDNQFINKRGTFVWELKGNVKRINLLKVIVVINATVCGADRLKYLSVIRAKL